MPTKPRRTPAQMAHDALQAQRAGLVKAHAAALALSDALTTRAETRETSAVDLHDKADAAETRADRLAAQIATVDAQLALGAAPQTEDAQP